MTRTPDELLEELRLQVGAAARRRAATGTGAPRRARPTRRLALMAAVLVVGATSSAVATRELWGPSPSPLLDRGPRAADAIGPAVVIAGGEARGSAWQLSGRTCRFGSRQTISLALRTDGGGLGRSCAAPPPADRMADAYADLSAGVTFVYAAVPASARSVVVRGRGEALTGGRLAAEPSDVRTTAPARPPEIAGAVRGTPLASLRYVVAVLPGRRDVRRIVAYDEQGRVVDRCGPDGRCR